jgi:integrase
MPKSTDPTRAPRILTDQYVVNLKPRATRFEVFDLKARGLTLRVTPNGVKSWHVRYRRGRLSVRVALEHGRYPGMSLATARDTAGQLLAGLSKGQDPQLARHRAKQTATVRDVAADYLKSLGLVFDGPTKRWQPAEGTTPTRRSWREIARTIERDILSKWAARPITDITPADAEALIAAKQKTADGQSNKVRIYAKALFDHARKRMRALDRAAINPMQDVDPRPKVERARVLTPEELRTLLEVLDLESPRVRSIVRLLLLTAARQAEVVGLQWAEIDRTEREWTVPAERVKTTRPDRRAATSRTIPLSDAALAILDDLRTRAEADALDFERTKHWLQPNGRPFSPFVFPSKLRAADAARGNIQKALERLRSLVDARLDRRPSAATAWRGHDLRRTAASLLGELGFGRDVIRVLLGHSDGSVVAVYDRSQRKPQVRAAVEALARELDRIEHNRPAETAVVPFAFGGVR